MPSPTASLLHRIGRKSWTDHDVARYVGPFRDVRLSYAADPALRSGAASGGSTTAILLHLLEQGAIDGALVLRSVVTDGRVGTEFFVARTRAELLEAQGSKYMAVRFGHDALPKIAAFDGRLAVVALPCDCTKLLRARERDPALHAKVRLVIALTCGHNSEPELTDHVVTQLGRGRGALKSFRYRSGHWRGELTAEFENGERLVRPFSELSDYRNVYICAQRKCHSCHDHYGYHADISVGDIWSLAMRDDPIKHTFLLSRSEAGEAAVAAAHAAGALRCRATTIRDVMDGQSRTLPFHYNTTARARVGRLLGIHVKDTVQAPVRWSEYLTAFIAMSNEKFSRSAAGRRILLSLPRPLLRLYLYLFKGLELL